jgi:hypothetical protein
MQTATLHIKVSPDFADSLKKADAILARMIAAGLLPREQHLAETVILFRISSIPASSASGLRPQSHRHACRQ